jgi:hypothetical protein
VQCYMGDGTHKLPVKVDIRRKICNDEGDGPCAEADMAAEQITMTIFNNRMLMIGISRKEEVRIVERRCGFTKIPACPDKAGTYFHESFLSTSTTCVRCNPSISSSSISVTVRLDWPPRAYLQALKPVDQWLRFLRSTCAIPMILILGMVGFVIVLPGSKNDVQLCSAEVKVPALLGKFCLSQLGVER